MFVKNFKRDIQFSLFFLSLLLSVTAQATGPQSGIAYHGRIIKPDGTPLESDNVSFRLQIRSLGSENCVLFEEIHVRDMSNSAGIFAVTLNDGQGNRTDSTGYTLDQVFGNRGKFVVPTGTCDAGAGVTTEWQPNASDGRRFQVHFKDSSMTTWEPMPIQNIDFVPMAIEAKQVGGYHAKSLLRVENNTTPGTIDPLTQTHYDELMNLILGTSTQYTKVGHETDSTVKSYAKANLPVCGVNEFLKATGINTWSCVAVVGASGGTVTSLTVGSGLIDGGGSTGTNITSTGTIAADFGTTSGKVAEGDDVRFNPTPIIGNALNYVRVNTGGTAYEVVTAGTILSAGGAIINGGNSLGATLTVGTNDAQSLAFETNNSTAMTIVNNGSVGIGTPTPAAKLDVAGDVKVGNSSATCNATTEGSQRYNSIDKAMEFCNGTAWTAFDSGGASNIPAGAIMAFDLTSCPTGWSEYTAAYGRFLRGIDKSGTNIDPSGQRAPGDLQNQGTAVNGMSVSVNAMNYSPNSGWGYGTNNVAYGAATGSLSSTDPETRPKNVAVLFCRKD